MEPFEAPPDCSNIEERFWGKVHKTATCWEWTARIDRGGYGWFWPNKTGVLVHRFVWTITYGPILKGLCICHHCDNRKCVNPKHLFLGTYSDNRWDASSKGRLPGQNKTHCPNGHPYNCENTYFYTPTRRHCRICAKDNQRKYRATRSTN